MKISSSEFPHQGQIPDRFTCDDLNVHPPLEFSGIPHASKSLVLIMDDPDVPEYVRKDRMYVHWVLFNIPPSYTKILEGVKPQGTEGANTSGDLGYSGPCPPDREHRYYFKLYALDADLKLSSGATKEEVLSAMKGHLLAEAELMGRYNRKSRR